jgi:hypothetical protein
MMDCKQFREILDCYLDLELSPEAMAAADAHLRECGACERVAAQLRALRQAVRRVVAAEAPPPGLERRVRASLWPQSPGRLATAWASRLSLAAVALLAIALTLGFVNREHAEDLVASTMDQAVVRLSDARNVVLDGVVLCRDCELHQRYGAPAVCERIGHHGAIATSDGRIWNIIEYPSSADLIHDHALLGKSVRVRGRMYRTAGTIAIDTYQIL